MARIRTIKPDFWTDGNIVKLSPFARLLYIGMWNFTLCDHGHLADDAFKLKLQILPMDNVDIEALLAEIMESGRVARVKSPEGRTFLHVTRFEDHQKIDPRWKTRCPACAHRDSLVLDETPVSFSETQRDSPELPATPPRKGREGKGKEICTPQAVSESEFETWWTHYPRKLARGQAEKAFKKARKIADLDTLVSAVKAYAKSVHGKDPDYIAYGATWLNGKRWMDENITPATDSAINDWLRKCWDAYDIGSIEDRSGMTAELPDAPEDVEDFRAFNLQSRRNWITENRDEIIRRIMAREANAA